MNEEELIENYIYIETYGGGFIIEDYSGRNPGGTGARYRGASGGWRDLPVITDPFPTREAALKVAATIYEEATT